MDPSTIDSVHARVGTTVREKWVLGQVIGAGGTAAVYEATHRTNGKRVAVKVMHSFLASSPDLVARFQREGYIANKVGHPGAVAILDDDTTDDGAPFLVMERLEGEPLSRILDHAADGLAVGQVLSIAHEVLDILGAAHAKGIVHRDIKPDNVFLTTSGRIMVLDFGIARLHEQAQAQGMAVARTQDGSALGTPQYMAPEQARGRWSEVDAQSDLWSVGAMLFRLLTGKPVRDQNGAAEMLLSAMTEPARSVLSVGAVPRDIAAIVDKALEFEKKDRWPDARAMQDAIRDAAGKVEAGSNKTLASSLVPSSRATATAAAPLRPSATNRTVVILAASLLALAGAAVALRSRREPAQSFVPPVVESTAATAPVTSAAPEVAPAPSIPPVDGVDSAEAAALPPRGLPVHRRHGRPPVAPTPAPAHSFDASDPSPSLLDRRH